MTLSVAAACIAEVCVAEACAAEACSDVEVKQTMGAMGATPSIKAMRGVVLPPAIWEQGIQQKVSGGGHKMGCSEGGGTRSHEGGGRKEHACFCAGVNGENRRGTGVGCKFRWVQEEIQFCIHKRSRFDRFGRCTHRLV